MTPRQATDERLRVLVVTNRHPLSAKPARTALSAFREIRAGVRVRRRRRRALPELRLDDYGVAAWKLLTPSPVALPALPSLWNV
jgi:hypothetical protein